MNRGSVSNFLKIFAKLSFLKADVGGEDLTKQIQTLKSLKSILTSQ